ncbi:hypothetical protein ACFOOL_15465 [Devosia honganensis]|uniref:Uncharacterized protein n=1 Tax=Devosia honganensis TaxID=1610527 RepID=A0ABV7X7Y1_9HYPH
MGKLLKFAARKKSEAAGTSVSGDAQILIFTGVRYERWAPPPPETHAQSGRRKRKRG